MAGVKAIKSMNTYQRLVENLAMKAEEVLRQVPQGPGLRPSPRLIQRLEEAEKKLRDQYSRMYDAYASAIVDTDLKSVEEEQIETIIKAAETRRDTVVGELEKVLDGIQAVEGSNQGSSRRSARIEEVLKPKEPLTEAMNLEEVEHWIKGYEAFMDHNKDVLNEEGIKVSRAILDKCLDPKLSTRLRNAQNEVGKNLVKDDTPIKDCLKVLKDMFLEAMPLWLRRLNYFNCSQTSDESVPNFGPAREIWQANAIWWL